MKRNRKKYDFAFKEKAVIMSYQRNISLAKLEKELGLFKAALSTWRQEYEKFNTEDSLGNNYLKVNIERQRIQELEKKTHISDAKFEILKKAGKNLHHGKPMIFHFIADNEKQYPIRLMCEVLGINRGTYSKWKNGITTEAKKRKKTLQNEITTMFFAFKQRYGSVRITVELKKKGYKISSTTVSKHMKELGLYSKIKKN
ncbi:transposase [Flavobacterium aquidurense]|uniref:transposase n=1 Tax=Flavobacterium aquidurense TaxID=362413 RepID=UPI0037581DA8